MCLSLFCTCKGTSDQGKGACKKAILEQIEKLQVSHVDLVLIHWPGSSRLNPSDPKNAEQRKGSWEDLEELCQGGKIKSIGVSNYTIRHLVELLTYAKIKPVVNQVRLRLFTEEAHLKQIYLVFVFNRWKFIPTTQTKN